MTGVQTCALPISAFAPRHEIADPLAILRAERTEPAQPPQQGRRSGVPGAGAAGTQNWISPAKPGLAMRGRSRRHQTHASLPSAAGEPQSRRASARHPK